MNVISKNKLLYVSSLIKIKCYDVLLKIDMNIRENRRGNQEWTIPRYRRHWMWDAERRPKR